MSDPVADVKRLADSNLRSLENQANNALTEERKARDLAKIWHEEAMRFGKECDLLRTFIGEHFPPDTVGDANDG